MRATIVVLVVIFIVVSCKLAAADSIHSNWDGYQEVQQGTRELSLDSMLLFNYNSRTFSETEVTLSTISSQFTFGGTFRYFVIDNLALSFNANFFFNYDDVTRVENDVEASQSISEYGCLGFVMAHYYLKAGKFFFAPGIGGGGFYGSRSIPVDGQDLVTTTTIYGGAVRLDLNLVFYTSRKFNLHAGLSAIMWIGNDQPDDEELQDEESSILKIDAGFNIGMTFVL